MKEAIKLGKQCFDCAGRRWPEMLVQGDRWRIHDSVKWSGRRRIWSNCHFWLLGCELWIGYQAQTRGPDINKHFYEKIMNSVSQNIQGNKQEKNKSEFSWFVKIKKYANFGQFSFFLIWEVWLLITQSLNLNNSLFFTLATDELWFVILRLISSL